MNVQQQAFSYTYDDLNRLTSKTSSALHNVTYTYDLLGRMRTAKFDATFSNQGITNAYDALGRLTSSSNNLGGTARPCRTSTTLPGGASGRPGPTASTSLTTGW